MTSPSAVPDGLPEYDDERHTDAHVIYNYLLKAVPDRWSKCDCGPDCLAGTGDLELITDVIGALLATGDATLVKNPTYRAMRRDGADVERLAAGLSKLGYTEIVVQADGNPVTATLTILEAVQRIAADAMNAIRGEVAP